MFSKIQVSLFFVLFLCIISCDNDKSITKSNNPPITHDNLVVSIEQTELVQLGESITLDVTLDDYSDSGFILGGFDFYLSYDLNALEFDSLIQGEMISYCGWWYYASRHYIDTVDGTEVGAVTFTSFSNQHSFEADCYTPTDSSTNQIARLYFTVTSDEQYAHRTVPVRFLWRDCNDNNVYNGFGQIFYMSNQVIQNGIDVSTENPYPNYTGHSLICDSVVEAKRADYYRSTDFVNGAVRIK